MARINIEDSLWADTRFQDLMIRVGNRHAAKGMILELWTIAQKFWLSSGGRGIPRPAWESNGIPDVLIECGLARDDGDFIYAIGSREQFSWLNASSENGKKGGPAAAKSRRENTGKSKRRKSSENVENRPDTTSFSSSSSFSSSFSDSPSSSEELNLAGELVAPAPQGKSVATWEAYRDAYRKRYGTIPVRNAAVNGKLSQLVSRLGAEEAPLVAEFYLTHNAFKYVNAGHSVGLLLMDAEKLRTEWATGDRILESKAREIERTQSNLSAWDKAADMVARRKESGHG